jgi:hypothetical protein
MGGIFAVWQNPVRIGQLRRVSTIAAMNYTRAQALPDLLKQWVTRKGRESIIRRWFYKRLFFNT